MTRPLCAGLDPEWWTLGDDGNRLALAICGRCSGCPSNDPKPHGVIRQGVPYSDKGAALRICACGYPQATRRADDDTLCPRCALPGLDRWRSDVTAWAARGDSNTVMGRRLGFDRTTVRDALKRWAREDHNHAPTGAPTEEKRAA